MVFHQQMGPQMNMTIANDSLRKFRDRPLLLLVLGLLIQIAVYCFSARFQQRPRPPLPLASTATPRQHLPWLAVEVFVPSDTPSGLGTLRPLAYDNSLYQGEEEGYLTAIRRPYKAFKYI